MANRPTVLRFSGSKMNPYVVLNRLTEVDIARNTRRNVPSSSRSNDQAFEEITIKEESDDDYTVGNNARHYDDWNIPSSSNTNNQAFEEVTIKEEESENGSTVDDNVRNDEITVMYDPRELMELEYGTNIKTEVVDDFHEIKTEPVNTFENITDNHTASSNSIRSAHGEFNCDMCPGFFDNNKDFIIHKYISHKEKPYVCKICSAKFTLTAHLNIHLSEHVDYIHMKESCLETDIQLPSTIHLKRNLNKLKSSATLTRNVCQEVQKGPSGKNCRVPIKSTTTRKTLKCSVCKFVTMSEAKFSHHQSMCSLTPTSSRIYDRFHSCKLCSKLFINQTALNGHMRYHSLRGEIVSKRKNALNKIRNGQSENNIGVNDIVHASEIESVTDERKCNDCNKMFTTRNKLNIHLLQHKKQMMCNFCNKQFFLKKSFEKHMLLHKRIDVANDKKQSMHTQMLNNIKDINDRKKKNLPMALKPYQCNYCFQFYSTDKSLIEHVKQFHVESKSVRRSLSLKSESTNCNWCNAVITKCNLIRHVKTLHPEVDPAKCSYCFMKFKDFPSMKSHVSECHQN